MSMKFRFSAYKMLAQKYYIHFLWFWNERHKSSHTSFTPEEAEFLPAALSLQAEPISPSGRWTARILILIIVFVLLWSFFGRSEIIVTGEGVVIPSVKSKTISSVETAQVSHIYVEDGQMVYKGQPLIDLNTDVIEHEKKRSEVGLYTAELQVARSRALLLSINSGKFVAMENLKNIDKNKILDAKNLLSSQWENITSKQQELNGAIKNYNEQLPLLRKNEFDYHELAIDHDVSINSWREKVQARIEMEGKLKDAKHQLVTFISESRKKTEDELNDGLKMQEEMRQDAMRADAHKAQLQITSPVDGTIQQLATHTLGGVVTAAEPLMIIVPKNNKMIVEAIIENKDIGFVQKKQKVSVKIEAYDYTKYGMLDGVVSYISRDSIDAGTDNITKNQSQFKNSSVDHQQSTQSTQYTVYIDLNENGFNGKLISLKPGMRTSIEIKTGSRKIIDYFLSPLIQHVHESINER